jgi:hypothetical protein
MALSFNLTKIKNFADVCYEPDGTLTGLTTTIVWMLPVIGMPGITKATAKFVYLRIATYENLFGPMRGLENITMEEVLSHVGLTANVAFETDAKWERRIMKLFKQITNYRWDGAENERTAVERLHYPPVLDRHRLDHGGTDNV